MQTRTFARSYGEHDAASTAARGSTWSRVVVVSNRLPFRCTTAPDGTATLQPSSGGLVTALSPLLHSGIGGKWVGWLGGEEEGLEEALRSLADDASNPYELGIIQLNTDEEREYYSGFSNQVLVPLLVGTSGIVDQHVAHACWRTYLRTQQKFAREVMSDLRSGDIVWVHDYHLIGVGRELRRGGIVQPVGFFLHTPFPKKEAFKALPEYQARSLLSALLAYDIVGLQTRAFQENFIATIRAYLPDVRVSTRQSGTVITYRGHETWVGHFPVSIDADAFERQLFAHATQRNIRRLDTVLRRDKELQIIFDAGRQDYAKGFLEELLAFDLLLERHPELAHKVILMQLVIPSRTDVGAYRDYKHRIIALAREINLKYGRKVVRQIHGSMSTSRYLAHLHVANVQSIPTLSDGMNLIAKESAIVGHKTTVLVLGREAGVAEEFGAHALTVDPRDADLFADALYQALTMRLRERRRRKSRLKGIVTMHDVYDWWVEGVEPVFQRVWDMRTA